MLNGVLIPNWLNNHLPSVFLMNPDFFLPQIAQFDKSINLYNIISLSHHKQVCLSGLRFERYDDGRSRPDDGRSISRKVAHLNMLAHDVINLLCYEYWTDKQKYFYV